jgi:hypothetical protein
MRIQSSDKTNLQKAIDNALLREKNGLPEPPKIMWIARVPLLAIKPIRSTNPKVFMESIKELQRQYPKLDIYIFEIEGL